MQRLISIFLIVFALAAAAAAAVAQDAPPSPTAVPTTGPTVTATPSSVPTAVITATMTPTATATPQLPTNHVIAAGETLVTIAEQYGVTVEALQLVNGISDPALIYAGQELIIPGGEGAEVPAVYTVQFGDSLAGIAVRFNTTITAVAQANNLVAPDSLYAGQVLSLISRTGTGRPQPITGTPHVVGTGDTLHTIASEYGVPAVEIAAANQIGYPPRLYPGDRLRIPADQPYQFLPQAWLTATMRYLPARQGDTLAVRVANKQGGRPTGTVIFPDGQSYPLTFSSGGDGSPHVALFGLDAFAPFGRYTIRLSGEGPVRPWADFVQAFALEDAGYGVQQITISDSLAPLLAPDIRAEEDEFLATLFADSTAEKLWTGLFQQPVSTTIITAGYGDGRSYNGGPINIFHTGIDFAGTIGTPITAPADGRVLFAAELELRGNSIVLDHGLGVTTAYYHLDQLDVAEGETVTAGQQIGTGGNTGLSTGPHLHWDVRVWGTAVQPQQWLQQQFP